MMFLSLKLIGELMKAWNDCANVGKFGKFVELCTCYIYFFGLEFFICTKKEWIRSEVGSQPESVSGTFIEIEITQGPLRPIKALLLVGARWLVMMIIF